MKGSRLLFTLGCLCWFTNVSADDVVLTLPGEAKGAAMGEAYSASASGADGLWYNPGTLSRSDVPTASVMHTTYLENITFNTLGAVLPFGSRNAVGLGVSYLNTGSISSYDNTGTAASSYSPKDLCARLGIAKSISGTSFGLSAFFLRSTIHETASTVGLNVGLHQVMGPVSLAFVAENYGGKLTYKTEEVPLPSRLRTGVSVRLFPALLLNADVFKPKDGSLWIGTGTEFRQEINDKFNVALRGGYTTRSTDVDGLQGISGGVGFGMKDSDLNYAWIPFGDLGQTHRLSLTFQFGDAPYNPHSERELRSKPLLRSPTLRKTSQSIDQGKNQKGAEAWPLLPWKKKKVGWRTAKEKMMELLARDALCTGTAARALVTNVRGSVALKSITDDQKWSRVQAGRYLFEGDTLRTYANATADVVFANGTKAEVGANTLLTVETKTEICDHAVTTLKAGEMSTVSNEGKEILIQTPLGNATVKDAQARVGFDGKKVFMQVQSGLGNFTSQDVRVPIQANTTFAKTAEGKTEKTTTPKDQMATTPQITEPDFRTTPGRWDPNFTKEFSREVMRLDSIPGLQLAEYVRDNTLRKELKIKVFDMVQQEKELQLQLADYRADVDGFKALKESLKKVGENEDMAALRTRKRSLKQTNRALSNAQNSFGKIQKELKTFLREMRESQEFLAAIPIVRMLNITAQESTIPFDAGSAVVPDEAAATLDAIAESIVQMKPFRIVIEGHTDKLGSLASNKRLSKQRAAAVAHYLQKKTHLPARQFLTKGMGATQPLEQGDLPEMMAKNRRVEIWFELRGL